MTDGKLTAKLVLDTSEFFAELERAKAALAEFRADSGGVAPAKPHCELCK